MISNCILQSLTQHQVGTASRTSQAHATHHCRISFWAMRTGSLASIWLCQAWHGMYARNHACILSQLMAACLYRPARSPVHEAVQKVPCG